MVQWLIDNWKDVATALLAVVAAASAVTALTPTPKDDGIVSKIYKIIESLGLVVGKAKDKAEDK